MEFNVGDKITTRDQVLSLPLWTVLKTSRGDVYVKSNFTSPFWSSAHSWIQLLDNMPEYYDDRVILEYISHGDKLEILSLPRSN